MKHIVTLTSSRSRTGICNVCGNVKLIRRKRKAGIRWFCAIKEAEWRGKEDVLKDAVFGRTVVPPGTRERLLKEQNGRCKICNTVLLVSKKALDHCHTTGKIRGYLCRDCNLGISYFQDDPIKMRSAANYLEYYRKGE